MIQRVTRAQVRIGGVPVGTIDRGLAVLVGVAEGDDATDADVLADKVTRLRVFEDEAGKMNRAVGEVGGGVLLVSQFTLLGDCRKGRRPSFTGAAQPEAAEPLIDRVVRRISGHGIPVETGRFRAEMEVELVNEGPATLLIDTRGAF